MDKEKPKRKDLELGTKQIRFNDLAVKSETGGTTQKAKYRGETKPGTTSSGFEIPGLWLPSSSDKCCIYRVPSRLRRVNPEAYTPQMLLIGPIHHSKKFDALQLAKSDLRHLDIINMEFHKKTYLKQIACRYGDQTVEEFKGIIEKDEKSIRESYAESMDWIGSQEFVEMILYDSVFILGFLITIALSQDIKVRDDIKLRDDTLFQQPPHISTTIIEDLVLLENQLPYALLEKLFQVLFLKLETKETLRNITLRAFGFEGKIREEVKFLHFTDLFRRVRVETLRLTEEQISRLKAILPKTIITSMYNADKLDSAGLDFMNVDKGNDLSLVIKFEGGVLKMPCFMAQDNTEMMLRNLMAFEQCHYPFTAFICNYVAFLNFLINTEKDVELLVKRGVVMNWLGHQGLVAEMVHNLCVGIVDFGSYYHPIAIALNDHCMGRLNRSLPIMLLCWKRIIIKSFETLGQVYFKDLWTATATLGAVVLLVLTLIQTVASVLQVKQGQK